MIRVLGIDPGFASIGYAVAELSANSIKFLDVGVIHTKKGDKKTAIRASDDNLSRAREIHLQLSELVRAYGIVAITAESMSFPRSSSVAAKVSMVWGVIAGIANVSKLPVVQSSPIQVKKALVNNAKASKEDIMAKLLQDYPEQFASFVRSSPKGDLEHGFDAAATVIAGLPSEALQLARKLG